MEPMNALTSRTWPYLALLISSSMLIGAWIFQYGFDYAPCLMCYWQRHAHKVVIGVAATAIAFNIARKGSPRFWLILIALAFLGSFAVAFWHVGVEYKWWEGPKVCSASAVDLDDIRTDNLLESLSGPIKMPACSEAVWHFLGLSMAGWNALISLGAALMTLFVWKRDNA